VQGGLRRDLEALQQVEEIGRRFLVVGVPAEREAADGVDRVAAFAYCRKDVLDHTSWKRGPVNA
jgi:hypothetical protein